MLAATAQTAFCSQGSIFGNQFSVTPAHVSECLGCVQRVASQGQGSLPGQLVIVTDKGKTSKEQGNLVVKEAMCAMLQAWDAPFRSACILT